LLLSALLSCNASINHSDNSNTADTIKDENKDLTLNDKQTDSVTQNDDIEEKIIDTIFKLTEVKERARYIQQ
jgi:hypothetical protein